MAKQSGLLFASLAGALVGGLLHLIANKAPAKVDKVINTDDNKGVNNDNIQQPIVTSGDSQPDS